VARAGIGKSRLVQVLAGACRRRAAGVADAVPGSPYYRNTALYPIIDLLERVALPLRAVRESPNKAAQTRRVPGAVWPAAGAGSCPSLPPSSRSP